MFFLDNNKLRFFLFIEIGGFFSLFFISFFLTLADSFRFSSTHPKPRCLIMFFRIFLIVLILNIQSLRIWFHRYRLLYKVQWFIFRIDFQLCILNLFLTDFSKGIILIFIYLIYILIFFFFMFTRIFAGIL